MILRFVAGKYISSIEHYWLRTKPLQGLDLISQLSLCIGTPRLPALSEYSELQNGLLALTYHLKLSPKVIIINKQILLWVSRPVFEDV
jgi:hypothetical protein